MRPDFPAPRRRAAAVPHCLAAHRSQAPEASAKTREEKRFSRYDKNKDGKVQADEYLAARRRNFDKLDLDHNGALSFQEYAAKAIEKFNDAGGRKGWLTAAEFVATAPPQAKRKSTCSCGVKPPEVRTPMKKRQLGEFGDL